MKTYPADGEREKWSPKAIVFEDKLANMRSVVKSGRIKMLADRTLNLRRRKIDKMTGATVTMDVTVIRPAETKVLYCPLGSERAVAGGVSDSLQNWYTTLRAPFNITARTVKAIIARPMSILASIFRTKGYPGDNLACSSPGQDIRPVLETVKYDWFMEAKSVSPSLMVQEVRNINPQAFSQGIPPMAMSLIAGGNVPRINHNQRSQVIFSKLCTPAMSCNSSNTSSSGRS